jgi:hypothetical protein
MLVFLLVSVRRVFLLEFLKLFVDRALCSVVLWHIHGFRQSMLTEEMFFNLGVEEKISSRITSTISNSGRAQADLKKNQMFLSRARQTVGVIVDHLQLLSDSGNVSYDIDAMEALMQAVYLPGCVRHKKTKRLVACLRNKDFVEATAICQSPVHPKPLYNAVVSPGTTPLEDVLCQSNIRDEHSTMVETLVQAGCDPTGKGRVHNPVRLNIERQTMLNMVDHLIRDKINVFLLVHGARLTIDDVTLALHKSSFVLSSWLNLEKRAPQLIGPCLSGMVMLAGSGILLNRRYPGEYELFVRLSYVTIRRLCATPIDATVDITPWLLNLASLEEYPLSFLGDEIDVVFPMLLPRCTRLMEYNSQLTIPFSITERVVYTGNVTFFAHITSWINDLPDGPTHLSTSHNPTTGLTLVAYIVLSHVDFMTKMIMLHHLKQLGIHMHGKDVNGMTPLMHVCSMTHVQCIIHPLELMDFFIGCNNTTAADHQRPEFGMVTTPMSTVLHFNVGDQLVDRICLLKAKGFDEIMDKDHALVVVVLKCIYANDMETLETVSGMFTFDEPGSPSLENLIYGAFHLFQGNMAIVERFLHSMGMGKKHVDMDIDALDGKPGQTPTLRL